MLIGTFWIFSSRFCAVTMMSLCSSGAGVVVAGAAAVCAIAGQAVTALDTIKATNSERRFEMCMQTPQSEIMLRSCTGGGAWSI